MVIAGRCVPSKTSSGSPGCTSRPRSSIRIAVLTRFQVGDGSWRLSDLITYDANDFALLVVTALPIGMYSALRPDRSPWGRTLDWAGLTVLAITFVWAGSRGGFLALLATGGFFLWRFRAIRATTKISAVLAIGVVVALVAGPKFWEQMSTLLSPSSDYNLTSETGRIHVWKRGVGLHPGSPVLRRGRRQLPGGRRNALPLWRAGVRTASGYAGAQPTTRTSKSRRSWASRGSSSIWDCWPPRS